MKWYILNGHDPVPVSLLAYAQWELANPGCRIVEQTNIGRVKISTVFLGLDHGYRSSRPVLFETMIFNGLLDESVERYCTWDGAAEGHRRHVQSVLSLQ
jgi:hypothetical protein